MGAQITSIGAILTQKQERVHTVNSYATKILTEIHEKTFWKQYARFCSDTFQKSIHGQLVGPKNCEFHSSWSVGVAVKVQKLAHGLASLKWKYRLQN